MLSPNKGYNYTTYNMQSCRQSCFVNRIVQIAKYLFCVQTEAVKVPEEKKTEVKKQTSRNHQQRLANIVKQTVVESRVKHLY